MPLDARDNYAPPPLPRRARGGRVVIAPEAVDTVLLPIAQRIGRMADNPEAIREAYEQRLATYRNKVVDLEDALRAVNEELATVRAELDQVKRLAMLHAPEPEPRPAQLPPVPSTNGIDTAPGGRRLSIPVPTPYPSFRLRASSTG